MIGFQPRVDKQARELIGGLFEAAELQLGRIIDLEDKLEALIKQLGVEAPK